MQMLKKMVMSKAHTLIKEQPVFYQPLPFNGKTLNPQFGRIKKTGLGSELAWELSPNLLQVFHLNVCQSLNII